MRIRTYSELVRLPTFEERYDYLRIGGSIGVASFGFSRYINQAFYTSALWRSIRTEVILRDNACDLGIEDYQIPDRVLIHHMNVITEEDIENLTPLAIDPEFLISTCNDTHNAIHFGDASLLPALPIVRSPNDTSPWRN